MLPAGIKISLAAELQNAGVKPEIVLQISDNGVPEPAAARRR